MVNELEEKLIIHNSQLIITYRPIQPPSTVRMVPWT